MNAYLALVLFGLAILGFIGISLVLNALLFGGRDGGKPALDEPFECGTVPAKRLSLTRISVSYYKVAILFVLFDLEGIFLFLWAMAVPPFDGLLMSVFALFMLIFAFIFLYVWREGLLSFLPSAEGEAK